MRRFLCWAAALALLVTGCKSNDILSEVDPTIGGVGVLLQPTQPRDQAWVSCTAGRFFTI